MQDDKEPADHNIIVETGSLWSFEENSLVYSDVQIPRKKAMGI